MWPFRAFTNSIFLFVTFKFKKLKFRKGSGIYQQVHLKVLLFFLLLFFFVLIFTSKFCSSFSWRGPPTICPFLGIRRHVTFPFYFITYIYMLISGKVDPLRWRKVSLVKNNGTKFDTYLYSDESCRCISMQPSLLCPKQSRIVELEESGQLYMNVSKIIYF